MHTHAATDRESPQECCSCCCSAGRCALSDADGVSDLCYIVASSSLNALAGWVGAGFCVFAGVCVVFVRIPDGRQLCTCGFSFKGRSVDKQCVQQPLVRQTECSHYYTFDQVYIHIKRP